MDFNTLKNRAVKRATNYINDRRGWTTNRKIIVFESDDWGSIRMPDYETYTRLLNLGYPMNKSKFNQYDTLADKDDFSALYEILSQHKDRNGNHPVITANTIMANPDFEKIRENNFQKYFYEPFTETLKKYKNHDFNCWQEGIDHKLFLPQLHGREHLNVNRWMQYLQKPSDEVHLMFNNNLFGLGPNVNKEPNPSFVPAFDSEEYYPGHPPEKIISDGCKLFETIFDRTSKSFIAPNFYWNNKIEGILANNNIKYIQGRRTQKLIPNANIKYNYLGKRNIYDQIYLERNVNFEPAYKKTHNWISSATKEINKAFKLHKPATISIHRLNFIGGIFEENRRRNLCLFNDLLTKIIEQWPDIEFMDSTSLGDLISGD